MHIFFLPHAWSCFCEVLKKGACGVLVHMAAALFAAAMSSRVCVYVRSILIGCRVGGARACVISYGGRVVCVFLFLFLRC